MKAKDPKWLGRVDDDGHFIAAARGGFAAFMKSLAGQDAEVTVSKPKRQRSLSQNAFWWSVVVPIFAEACGYQRHEHEAVHDELIRVLVGLRPGSNPELQIRVSTTDMDPQDFNVLIEQAQIFGATKLGIVIPDPDPDWKQKARAARKQAA